MTTRVNLRPLFSPEVFAMLGGTTVAYVKAMRSDEVALIYPQAPQLVPGAIFGACGNSVATCSELIGLT